MTRTNRLLRYAALASVSVGMIALPSAARAHEIDDHKPITGACPAGTPGTIQNAVCFALRGVEYSVRHGGTVGAAQEFAGKTQGNAGTFSTATATNVGVFKTKIDLAVPPLQSGLIGGTTSALLKTDLYGAGLIQTVDHALATNISIPCPLNGVNPGVLQNTVQALQVLFCAQWAAIVATVPGDTGPLATHIGKLAPAVIDIEAPLGNALLAFKDAVAAAGTSLVGAVDAATQALAVNQVLDVFYGVQCVRKGDYGPFTRPTACPA